MSRLREIQQAFSKGLMEGNPQRLAAEIAPGESVRRSLALYRRAIRFTYTQVLKTTFPALLQLVGPRYFDTLARGYLKVHPSRSGDLFPFGRYFPAFLGELQVAPWLVELARLEWTCHEAYQAADSPPFSLEHLQAIASEDPARMTFRLHAASRLLRFRFPVHRVWRALQSDVAVDAVFDLPLPEEESGMVVARGDGKVQVIQLPTLEYRLLDAMSHGIDLASVEQMAFDADSTFPFSQFVMDLLHQHVLTGFSVQEQQPS